MMNFSSYHCDEMGSSKTEAFTRQQVELANIAKALAHPARVAILQLLLARTSCVCGDIVEELPLAQATVSQHLKVLKEAGLIKGEIDPRNSCYCIDYQAWSQFGGLISQFFHTPLTGPGEQCC